MFMLSFKGLRARTKPLKTFALFCLELLYAVDGCHALSMSDSFPLFIEIDGSSNYRSRLACNSCVLKNSLSSFSS